VIRGGLSLIFTLEKLIGTSLSKCQLYAIHRHVKDNLFGSERKQEIVHEYAMKNLRITIVLKMSSKIENKSWNHASSPC
jgi:hypothetical protein